MRFDLPDDKTLTYEMRIPIRWGDMDAMGHVNNTVYFRYLETLRIDWFRSIGCLPDADGIGPVIINAFCSFIRQLEYPGEVIAKHYVGALGRSTMDTYATLERSDDPGVVYASGGATVVWTNFRLQKSVPLPDDIRAMFTK
ncbi:acyl-CoA thioesterase [Aquabacterium sp.]|uniref:acyl-CoA thioesterase n=1 Tax=Aquabacterium sp. TaxID=1872578 RepID=UPI003784A39E